MPETDTYPEAKKVLLERVKHHFQVAFTKEFGISGSRLDVYRDEYVKLEGQMISQVLWNFEVSVFKEDKEVTIGYRYASTGEWLRAKFSKVLEFLAIPYKPRMIPIKVSAVVMYPTISLPSENPVVHFIPMKELPPLLDPDLSELTMPE